MGFNVWVFSTNRLLHHTIETLVCLLALFISDR